MKYFVYPATLVTVVVLAFAAFERGVSAPIITAVAGGSVMLWLTILERTFPFSVRWREPRSDRVPDIIHFVVSVVLMDGVTQGLITFGAMVVASTSPLAGLWPSSSPLALQVVFALVISELGGYFAHRLMHASPLFWRLHAVHHSAERLYFFNAFRNHPLDIVFSTAATILPLAVLGIPPAALIIVTVFSATHLLFQHANVDYRAGWLSRVLSVGEAHRWRHSRDLGESNANYGNVLLIWDVVFGTWSVPHRRPPEDVGLADGGSMNPAYVAHLLSPFRRNAGVAARAPLPSVAAAMSEIR